MLREYVGVVEQDVDGVFVVVLQLLQVPAALNLVPLERRLRPTCVNQDT